LFFLGDEHAAEADFLEAQMDEKCKKAPSWRSFSQTDTDCHSDAAFANTMWEKGLELT